MTKRRPLTLGAATLAAILFIGCSTSTQTEPTDASQTTSDTTEVNTDTSTGDNTQTTSQYTTSTQTVTGYTLNDFIAEIKDYPLLYEDGVQAFASEPDQGTYVIPGLIQTATLQDGKPTECTDMVPQGIATTDQYVIISAYDKNKACDSVLYILDKDSHEYIKTVVIDGKDHVGGIAYNPATDYLWVATKKDGTASASSIKMSDIETYDFDSDYKAIPFSDTIEVDSLTEDSFMTVNDGTLYLGTFTSSGDSQVESFDITSPGKISSTPIKTETISDWCQGIAFYNDYVLLSDSDGHSESALRIFNKGDTTLTDNSEITSFTLPERLEQVCVDGNKAYVIFESAANAYSDADTVKLGCVVTVDLTKVNF